MTFLDAIRKLRHAPSAAPLFGLAAALGLLGYAVVQAARGQPHGWQGIAVSLLLGALQAAGVRSSRRPAPPPKDPPEWARSDSIIYGTLTAIAVALLTLVLAHGWVDGPLWLSVGKQLAVLGLALASAWGALRGVTLLPLRAARVVGLAVAAVVIVLVLASSQ